MAELAVCSSRVNKLSLVEPVVGLVVRRIISVVTKLKEELVLSGGSDGECTSKMVQQILKS